MADPFTGYQPEGPIPGRPWWRECDIFNALVRDDGVDISWGHRGVYVGKERVAGAPVNADGDDLQAIAESLAPGIDRDHPRPCPPPMVGQLWRDSDGEPWVLQGFEYKGQGRLGRPYRLLYQDGEIFPLVITEWPPLCHALIGGPGAPWAPANYTPGESPREER